MPENFETMWADALKSFGRMVDEVGKGAEEKLVKVNDGSCMGCPRLVPAYGHYEKIGIRDGIKAAKEAFTTEVWRLFEPKEAVDRERWENEMIATLCGSLEDCKYYGDPEDEEQNGHNMALDMVIKKVPAFVKGVKIDWTKL